MLDLNGKSILITGGTGSFGKKFVEMTLQEFPQVRRLVVFSRDELKQFEMSQRFPVSKYNCLRYFIGDVRDRSRLNRAFEDIDIVIHAAALKQVPAAEYNPTECIRTNVQGAENVIEAALANGVQRVVALSTDKASAPVNLYGATKLCSDKLFIAANNVRGKRDIKFSVVRYGNVIGSRGSVVPFFLQHRENGFLPITHEEMTRFNISLMEGVQMVFMALDKAWGGELFVPKLPSFKVTDLAEAIAPGLETRIVGVRPGEKIHEEMITEMDALNTLEFDKYFVVVPAMSPSMSFEDWQEKIGGETVHERFKYESGGNKVWLGVSDLQEQIRRHVDPKFEPLV